MDMAHDFFLQIIGLERSPSTVPSLSHLVASVELQANGISDTYIHGILFNSHQKSRQTPKE